MLLAACTAASSISPPHDILGVTLAMPRDEVRAKLGATGKLLRQERKRQEVWQIDGNPRFASAIVGYDKQWNVRFITAVAKEGGERVRYADVLDLAKAEHRSSGASHTYTWKRGGAVVTAIGTDGEFLTYYSLKTE